MILLSAKLLREGRELFSQSSAIINWKELCEASKGRNPMLWEKKNHGRTEKMCNRALKAISGQGVWSSVFAVRKIIVCQAKWRSVGAGSYGCAGVVVGRHWLREVMRTAGCQTANRKTAKKTPTSNDISSEQNMLHQLGNFHYLLVMISLQSQGDRGQIKKKKNLLSMLYISDFRCNM